MSLRDVHKGKEFPKLALREGDYPRLRINSPPQDFLGSGPIALPQHELLDAHLVLGISW